MTFLDIPSWRYLCEDIDLEIPWRYLPGDTLEIITWRIPPHSCTHAAGSSQEADDEFMPRNRTILHS
jgi:hypothetical protein